MLYLVAKYIDGNEIYCMMSAAPLLLAKKGVTLLCDRYFVDAYFNRHLHTLMHTINII